MTGAFEDNFGKDDSKSGREISTLQTSLKKPIDIPTQETAAFIESHVPSGAEILEVGCSEGHVACELLSRGYRAIGVESDHEAVAKAQKRGVSAIAASWPEFDGPQVDAVAFTRSLHHIGPLLEALGRAWELLTPNGSLLLEDFAFDEVSEETIRWFLALLRSHPGRAFINPVAGELVTDLLQSGDPVAVWRKSRGHELHSMTAMSRAIAERFVVRETQSVPYLYRYLVPVLGESPEAAEFVEEVLRDEALVGARGEIMLIGRRIVASP